jgi:hypothetical protein
VKVKKYTKDGEEKEVALYAKKGEKEVLVASDYKGVECQSDEMAQYVQDELGVADGWDKALYCEVEM